MDCLKSGLVKRFLTYLPCSVTRLPTNFPGTWLAREVTEQSAIVKFRA